MIPKPPSSEDGSSLPPRHHPNMGDLANDMAEMDLWAFDDADISGIEPLPLVKPIVHKTLLPRKVAKKNVRLSSISAKDEEGQARAVKSMSYKESVIVNVSMERPKTPAAGLSGLAKAEPDFDDLDHWDEQDETSQVRKISTLGKLPPVATSRPTPVELPPLQASAGESNQYEPEIQPDVPSDSWHPHLALSKVEWISLVALVAMLLIGGGLIYLATISRLPQGADLAKANDFPIQGKHVTIATAQSYWRAPVNSGAAADTFRPGTLLLPVARLTIHGGPAAVRVFFRTGDGTLIGDTVTRAVRTGETLEIAATGGFEEAGAYAAYRTGQSKPWVIEVHEAPSGNVAGLQFVKLFEMMISSDRR